MQISLNGKPTEVPEGSTIANLVESLALTGRRMAVEVNEEVIPKSTYAAHRLAPGDRVEIVHAVGGG